MTGTRFEPCAERLGRVIAPATPCGFSSTHHGDALSADEQWRKLALVVEVAREVWRNA